MSTVQLELNVMGYHVTFRPLSSVEFAYSPMHLQPVACTIDIMVPHHSLLEIGPASAQCKIQSVSATMPHSQPSCVGMWAHVF